MLEQDGGKTLLLQALSNGPTLAFKDMAMQLLGNLFEYALAKDNAELNIFGATSGDTGSAAEYAMRGKKGIRVFMLSPHKKMSAFQTAQMFSLQDPNIFNIAVEGVFDDCQDMVKAVSNDLRSRRSRRSAPSIRSTGRASWRKWCTTSAATWRRRPTTRRRSRSRSRRGTSAISAPATSPA